MATCVTTRPVRRGDRKNPVRYNLYRTGCGRDARLKQLWGDKAGH